MDLPTDEPRGAVHGSGHGTPNSVTSPFEAASTTPPKLPPNPQKLQAMHSLTAAMTDITQHHEQIMVSENDARLRQAADGLNWIESAANTEAAELERLIAASHENESILQAKIAQARTVIADAQTRAQPNIDDVVCAETVVYNQLYDLVTEDSAIEDTIYVLSKALENDRINLDTFLKVRFRTVAAATHCFV